MTALTDLDPAALGADARRRVEAHVSALVFALGFGASWQPNRPGDSSEIELTVASLVRYAQTGADQWGEFGGGGSELAAESAADALLALHGALYRSASDDPAGELPRAWLADDEDPLALVARAALARVAIARGDGVRRAHLATLAGVDPRSLRAAVTEGRLVDEAGEEREGGGKTERPITAESARAWLEARGVPGYRA